MYPKWLTKLDLGMSGRKEYLRTIYVWRGERKLTRHSHATYQIYGAAEIFAERFLAFCMRFYREFGEHFDRVVLFPRSTPIFCARNNPLLTRLEQEGTLFVDAEKVLFLTPDAQNEFFDLIGRDVKALRRSSAVWDGMYVLFYPKGSAPRTASEVAAWWNEFPEPVLESMVDLCDVPQYTKYATAMTNFCLNVGVPESRTDSAEQALEGWFADAFLKLDLNAEWFVTGRVPESIHAFFHWLETMERCDHPISSDLFWGR